MLVIKINFRIIVMIVNYEIVFKLIGDTINFTVTDQLRFQCVCD